MATVNGTSGDNTLTGTTSADTINGLAGNDTITAGAGNDTLKGGEDNDVYRVAAGGGYDIYADGGTAGTDRILATADNFFIGLKSGFGPASGIEQISADGHVGITIRAEAANDKLDFSTTQLIGIASINGGAGNDTIIGSAGADTIVGSTGNDVLNGGLGGDTYLIGVGDGIDSITDSGGAGAGTDSILASADNVAIGLKSGFGAANGIEQIGANGHIGVTILGAATDDTYDFSTVQLTGIGTINGGAGNDSIKGSAAADRLAGGTGNDTLDGGGGSDTYVVGVGHGVDSIADTGSATDLDRILATASNVAIGLKSGLGAANGIEQISSNGFTGVTILGAATDDTYDFSTVQLVGISSINGGAGNDSIKGSAVADKLVGGAGNDTLDGGGGNDSYLVGTGAGIDTVADTGSAADTDRILATANNVAIGLRSGFGATNGIEEISANAFTGVTIQGSASADTLDFSATKLVGITAINGGAGADTIVGSAGNDALRGQEDSDTYLITKNAGFDSIVDTGLLGTDSIRAAADNVAISLKGNFGAANGIEQITADGHAGVTIQGDSADNTLDFSTTSLLGISAINGGAGNDTIVGSVAGDTIVGAAGNDTLKGGDGVDTYLIGKGEGFDSITDTGLQSGDRILAAADNTVIGIRAISGIELISANAHVGVSISGDTGNNTLDFSATTLTGISSINGGAGNDTLTGSAGNDRLIGGAGADRFVLTADYTGATASNRDLIADFVTGTDKLDLSKLDADATAPGQNAFHFLGTKAFDGAAGALHTVYDSVRNVTTLEADTNGDKVADLKLELNGKITLATGDFAAGSLGTALVQNGDDKANILNGAGGPDTLNGLGGDDELRGNDGDDVLNGGPGSDWMYGGAANDTYFVDTYSDYLTEEANSGTDTVISAYYSTYLDSYFENLTLAAGSGAIFATGNTEANVIVGNENANVITGRAGADILTGGADADTFMFATGDGGAAAGTRDLITDFQQGTDKIDLDQTWGWMWFIGSAAFDGSGKSQLHTVYDAARNVTILEGDIDGNKVADYAIELSGKLTLTTNDFVYESVQVAVNYTGPGPFHGMDLNDTITGGEGFDHLAGNGGDDVLDGRGLSDELNGGDGNDTLFGGTGNDALYGDNSTGKAGNDTLDGGADDDGLYGYGGDDDLRGGSGNDLLLGDSGKDKLDGGTGEDLLYGGDGDDTYSVDHVKDEVHETNTAFVNGELVYTPSTGVDTIIASVSYTLPADVEILTLKSGAGPIDGTGSATANTIIGNEAANVIAGAGGADTLTGGAGGDVFLYETGDTGSTAGTRDRITDFVAGVDQLDLSEIDANTALAGWQSFNFVSSAAFSGAAGEVHAVYDAAKNLTLVEADTNGDKAADFGIELSGNIALTKSDFVPIIIDGNSSANTIAGTTRQDLISGFGGDDTITGGAGSDTIDGGTGNDTAVFVGKAEDYQLIYSLGGIFVADLNNANGYEGFDGLFNIEHLKFADKTIDISTEPIVIGVAAGDAAGLSVSGAGDVNKDGFADFIIGAPNADGKGANSGASYVVFGSAAGVPDALQLSALNGANGFKITGAAAGDNAGFSVAGAGDVNGDGFEDVIIGALNADPNGGYSGAAYVVFGQASGFAPSINVSALDGTNGFRLTGSAQWAYAGMSVDAAGDLNNDGYDDVIVGVPGIGGGSAYVVFGHAGSFAPSINLTSASLGGVAGAELAPTPGSGSSFAGLDTGFSVSSAGDFNGDGIDDVLVGMPGDYGLFGHGTSGSAYVVFGQSGAFGATTYIDQNLGTGGIRIVGAAHGQSVGYSVAGAGDVNGDGFDDVIVSSPRSVFNNIIEPTLGNAYVVFGSDEPSAAIDLAALDGSNGFVVPSLMSDDLMGYSVSSAGDVNGDGFADLLIGAPDGGNGSAGVAYVLFGHAGGFDSTVDLKNLNATQGFWVHGDYAGDAAGVSVSGAGDINGDGFDDLLVGAPGSDFNGSTSGAVEVIYGSDLLGIERQVGTAASNTLDGTAAADSLQGRDGDDTLNGLGAGDTLLGENGNDKLNGGGGNDTLLGGKGNDVLTGGAGNDAIDGGAGNDTAGFAGNLADYSIVFKAGVAIVTDLNAVAGGNDGVDTLSGVEWLKFAAKTVELNVPVASKDLADLLGTDAYRFDGASAGQFGDQLGSTVANAGDVNGDGYDDMLMTAMSGVADGLDQAGRTFVVYGGASNLAAADSADGVVDGVVALDKLGTAGGFRLDGGVAGAFTGFSASAAGDVNGDGYADVVVSGRDATPNGTSYVIYGGAASLAALDGADGKVDGGMNLAAVDGKTGFTIDGAAAGDQSGWSVASAGDINNDGYDDVVVASRNGSNDGKGHSGAAYVVFGGPDAAALDLADGKADGHLKLANLSASTGLRIDGFTQVSLGDIDVNAARDVNGDGIADFTITKPFDGPGGSTNVALIYGGAQHLAALDAADGAVDGRVNPGSLDGVHGLRGGFSSIGDLNGDGISDLITSSPTGFFLAFGGSANLQALDATDGKIDGIVGSSSHAGVAGYEVASTAVLSSAGDVNGDGNDDLLVGTPGVNADGNEGAGASYVVYGGAANLAALDAADGAADGKFDIFNTDGITGFRLDGAAAGDATGFSVSAAGDVNGDGYADLLIGAPWGDGGGSAYVVYGGNFTGAVTHLGDAADNSLTGTGKAETFIGGTGNDTINGGGGADSIDAGVGADQIHVSDRTFHRVDGGGGEDVLHLDFSGAIDFGNIDATAGTSDRGKIANVEVVDVDNGVANALTLHLADVLDIDAGNLNVGGKATLDNVLKVEGNSGDTLHLVASEGWGAADTSTLTGYAIYSVQHVQVAVDTQIAVTVS